MSSKVIREQNIKFAKFMGCHYEPSNAGRGYKSGWYKSDPAKDSLQTQFTGARWLCRSHNDLRFGNDWNWIMDLVKKINSICAEKQRPLSNRSKEQRDLPDPLNNPLHWKSWSCHSVILTTDIDSVYKMAVEFLNWYDERVGIQ